MYTVLIVDCSLVLLYPSNKNMSLNLHVWLAADAAVNNKPSTSSECTPAAEVQAEAKDGHDETADEELCSTSAVVGNIPEMLTQEFLEMLVENVMKGLTSQAFTLEVIPFISSAVVTFQSEKGTHSVLW